MQGLSTTAFPPALSAGGAATDATATAGGAKAAAAAAREGPTALRWRQKMLGQVSHGLQLQPLWLILTAAVS